MSTHPVRHLGIGRYSHAPRQAPQLLMDDSDFLRRLKLGDESATMELYDRHSQLVFSLAHQVTRDAEGSEEVLQDVFRQLWRDPDAFDPTRGSLLTWLIVESRRRAIDWLRKRKAEIRTAGMIAPVNQRTSDGTAGAHTADRLSLFLQEMPENLRVTFELAYMQGLTASEISQRTGVSVEIIKSRVRLAMNWIRSELECNSKHADAHRQEQARL